MARTKQYTRPYPKPLTTWTRFHLPRDQQWPTWLVDHNDIHVGPLAEVRGCERVSLGRMVENPEQAAYILEWTTLDDLRNFQSSPACAEFLRNLREDNATQATAIESGLALEHLTLDDASPSTPLIPSSRFMVIKHLDESVTREVKGRITLTTYLVPCAADRALEMWNKVFYSAFIHFMPRGSRFMRAGWGMVDTISAVCFLVLEEDRWVEDTFGKLEQTQAEGEDQHRTMLCHVHVWQPRHTLEHEETSAADPQARESWRQAISQVMPPATAWCQERWDIHPMPRFYRPRPEDPEELAERQEQARELEEYLRSNGFNVGEGSE